MLNNAIKVFLFNCMLLAGCAGVGSETFQGQGITISDEKMVENCKFLGDIAGLSSFYGVFAGPAYASARSLAVAEAKKMHASHVLFTNGNSHYGGTEIYGKAYDCKN